ncbi:MAG: methylmalonyl-CoA mutase small subunit [Geodermatophilaceae bacterium]|nr:methylmalonyl-CoA mutase small subunit [Geodermatophilaceae bacterium]
MAQPPDRDSAPGSHAEEVLAPQDVTAPEALGLAAGFPAPDREQWRERVSAVLRKSGLTDLPEPVEDALHSLVDGRLDVAPLYDAADAGDRGRAVGVPGLPPFVRGTHAGYGQQTGWDVRARHANPDVAVTQEAIAADLDNGATSLWLVVDDGAIPVDAIPDVLSDVLLDVAPIVLQAGSSTLQAADTYFASVESGGFETAALGGNLGADPFGDAVRTGAEADISVAVALARRCRDEFPSMRAIVVDGTAVHDAGAGAVEELGYSLAAGVGYLRALTEGGLDVDSAFTMLDFRYGAGADQFLSIAGLRAARRLWNRVGEVCGASADARAQRQHAVTSPVMMSRRDPWVNMLRTTVACFAAGVGGAGAVTVLPFDAALGLPDSFARRIARNTQTLLMEEGHLARVLDPAGGSWYVESLTEQLAVAAWEWFTEIERAGGLSAALSDGLIADRIASAWGARSDRLAHRRESIIGVSEFPNLGETLPVRRRPTAAREASGRGLPQVRAAEAFEALRDRVDEIAGDSRPAVFLATLGSVAASTAHATFAANLFQAAGLETPSNGSDEGNDAAILSAFRESGTSVVCLCGTDEAYRERGGALVDALAEAGANQIWQVALLPSGGFGQNHQESALTGDLARIDGHIFAGCDALAVLNTVLDELGVARDGGGGS